MVITDGKCGKVMLDVLEIYGGYDDLGKFMWRFEDVLEKENGEAGTESLSASKPLF